MFASLKQSKKQNFVKIELFLIFEAILGLFGDFCAKF